MDPNNNKPNQTPPIAEPTNLNPTPTWTPQEQTVASVPPIPSEPLEPVTPASPTTTQQYGVPTFSPLPIQPPIAQPTQPWVNPIQPSLPQELPQMPSEPLQPQPTFTPQQPPDWNSLAFVGQQPVSNPSEPQSGLSAAVTSSSVDVAPTDLSQLVTSPPALPNDQSLTLPSVDSATTHTPTNENNNIPQVVTSNGKRHISKWIFAVAGLILLLAISGSAYFLLFANNTQPIPEVEQSIPNPTIQSTPAPIIIEQEPVTSPSAQSSPSAKSAIELLRQRQNQQR